MLTANKILIYFNNFAEGLCVLSLVNSLGIQIEKISINCDSHQQIIDLSNFNQGVYTLKITNNIGNTLKKKIVLIK